MDALKQQLLRIQQQLAGLSASQKMLTGSLVVIMIMTMFYWARYAGDSEFTPLLDQSMNAEETSRIKSALSAKGVSYEITGDRIMVPADKKFELIADLGYAELLPRDMADGFEDIVVKYDNPFASQKKTDQLWNHAKEKTLGGLISRWPGVKSATVMIDGTQGRNPARSIQPTAAVAISLKSGEQPSKKLADAAANLLAGSQAGLPGENVKVTINGQAIARGNKDGPFGDGDNMILKAKAEAERRYADKILEVIAYIPNAYATVSVDLNTKSTTINDKTVDPKGKVEVIKKSTSMSEENTAASAAGEPGLSSNAGATIEGSSAGGSGGNSTREQNTVENDTDHSVKVTQTSAPAGDAVPVAAAVRVPESYFVSIWKRKNPTSTSGPSDVDIQKLVEACMPQIRDAVRSATNIKDDTAISVAQYIDVSEPIIGSEASASSLASLPAGFGFGAKEIAIGVLAIISLFMVSMMVRKSVPPPVIPQLALAGAGVDVPQGPGAITVGADLAGEVGEGGMLLTGREMSDGDIESQQVISQVGTMIKDNPEVAANLVKRWLNRD